MPKLYSQFYLSFSSFCHISLPNPSQIYSRFQLHSFLSTLCFPKVLSFAYTLPVIQKSLLPSSIYIQKLLLLFKVLPKLSYVVIHLLPEQLYTHSHHICVNCLCSFLYLTVSFMSSSTKTVVIYLCTSKAQKVPK